MAATRLSDSQKIELVARFRAGEGSQALAGAYGCSTATVSRVVRGALDPAEYESLKQQGGRRAATPPEESSLPLAEAPRADAVSAQADSPQATPPQAVTPPIVTAEADTPEAAPAGPGAEPAGDLEEAEGPPGVLAIEDADDFGEDADPDDEGEDDSDEDLLDGEEGEEASLADRFAQGLAAREGGAVEVLPLAEARLPSSAYLLVDKTVELQAHPLSDFPELGTLDPEELERQALVLFLNPRQAKRQCGRSQRVIKIPDPQVFARTSRFLLAQGISRVLIEGSLYSLSGS